MGALVRSGPAPTSVASAGVALVTGLLAGSLTFPQVVFDSSSRPARLLLATGNSGTLPTAASGRPRFGSMARVALPLVTPGGELRVNLRLVTGERADVSLDVCGRSLGTARAAAGELARLVYRGDLPEPCALDLGLLLQPNPLPRGAMDASFELERVAVRSSAGLRLGPRLAVVIGLLPALVALAFRVAGMPGVASLLGALATASLALASMAFDPVAVAGSAPFLALAALLLGVAIRIRRGAVRSACRIFGLIDSLCEGSPGSRAPMPAIVGVALIPAILTLALLHFWLGRSPLQHVPAYPNDTTLYWLESAAFARAGWNGGYFTVGEYPARASFTRFGMHGPAFAVAYGGLGRVFGWQAWSAPVFNMVLVALALLLYALEARLHPKACILAASALATFWPMLLFLPTNMQEGLHFAAAALLAALIRPAFRAPLGPARLAVTLVLLIALSLAKPIWALLWPPLLLVSAARRSGRLQVLAFSIGTGLLVGSGIVYGWLMAPLHGQAVFFVRILQLDDTPATLWRTLRHNCREALQVGTGIELFQRALSGGLAALLVGIALTRRLAEERREALFHAWNIGVPLGAALLVYAVGTWNDYRILTVHLFLSGLLMLTSPIRVLRRLVVALAAIHLVAIPLFGPAYREVVRPNYSTSPPALEAFAAIADSALRFRPELDGWCNTLISTPPYLHPTMVGLPRGFGVTMIWPTGRDERRQVFRSAYVLVDLKMAPRPGALRATERRLPVVEQADGSQQIDYGDWARFRLTPLAASALGVLYRNLDSQCPP